MIFSKRATTIADDDEQFDSSGPWRLGVWGCAAVVAVTATVFASRTELGAKRFNAAYIAITASPSDPPPAIVGQLLARTADMERESRRLADTIRTLANERDRLVLRLGLVEREMGDLTGSITRGLSGMGKPADAKMTAPTGVAAPTASPPAIGAPMTVPVAPEPKNTRSPQTPAPSAALGESPAAAVPPAQPTDPAPMRTSSLPETIPLPTPRPGDQSMHTAGAPATNTLPLGAIRGAAAGPVAATDPAITPSQPQASMAASPQNPAPNETPPHTRNEAKPEADEPQPRVEIGLDLGPALTIARLRQRWAAFKAAHGALADGIRPVISMREVAQNKPAELRLVVGPVADVHVATQLCAALQGSQFVCTPAVFDGQRLAQK